MVRSALPRRWRALLSAVAPADSLEASRLREVRTGGAAGMPSAGAWSLVLLLLVMLLRPVVVRWLGRTSLLRWCMKLRTSLLRWRVRWRVRWCASVLRWCVGRVLQDASSWSDMSVKQQPVGWCREERCVRGAQVAGGRRPGPHLGLVTGPLGSTTTSRRGRRVNFKRTEIRVVVMIAPFILHHTIRRTSVWISLHRS